MIHDYIHTSLYIYIFHKINMIMYIYIYIIILILLKYISMLCIFFNNKISMILINKYLIDKYEIIYAYNIYDNHEMNLFFIAAMLSI